MTTRGDGSKADESGLAGKVADTCGCSPSKCGTVQHFRIPQVSTLFLPRYDQALDRLNKTTALGPFACQSNVQQVSSSGSQPYHPSSKKAPIGRNCVAKDGNGGPGCTPSGMDASIVRRHAGKQPCRANPTFHNDELFATADLGQLKGSIIAGLEL